MYKTIITLAFVLMSFISKANQEFPTYGEPMKPFYQNEYGAYFGQTGQRAKASIITCKMAKYEPSDIYYADELIPNLTFEIHPVGVFFAVFGEKWKFGHVVIKKNGQVVNQLMPNHEHVIRAPFMAWDEGYIDGSTHMFGNGWAVNYNTYTSDGSLYFGYIENFADQPPSYALRECNSDRSHSVPVFASSSSKARFELKNLDPL